MLEQADVVGHAVAALRDGREAVENTAVHLAGIGLSAHVKARVKAEIRREHAVHLVDLRVVALKQVDKAGFRAGGAAAAEELDVFDREINFAQIRKEILHPQRRALAYRHQLRGLIMRIAQRGQRLVLAGKVGQIGDHLEQLAAQVAQSVAVDDQIGVVGHVAARRAQMDDAGRAGRDLAERVHVRHHVMAHLFFTRTDAVVVNIRDMRLHFVDLLLRDGQAQRLLRPGQRYPQLAPGAAAGVGGKQLQHIRRCIAGSQRRFVLIGHGDAPYRCSPVCFGRIAYLRTMMLSRSGPTDT